MLSYASDPKIDSTLISIGADIPPDDSNIMDLLAKMLEKSIAIILRKGLNYSYKVQQGETNTIRGRIDFKKLRKKMGIITDGIPCSYDDYLPDYLSNQIFKATIKSLLLQGELKKEQRNRLMLMLKHFSNISDIKIRNHLFNIARIRQSDKVYRAALSICQFIYRIWLPNKSEVIRSGIDYSEQALDLLFEEFVRNFLIIRLKDTSIGKKRIHWAFEEKDTKIPAMYSDIVIQSDDEIIIIDCKFHEYIMLKSQHSDVPKINSEHMYQMHSYIANWINTEETPKKVTGIIMYAKTTEELDWENGKIEWNFKKEMSGVLVRMVVSAIDLLQSPEEIERSINEALS